MKTYLLVATLGWPALLWALPSQAVSGQVCGDGIVQPPETCDDGNTVNGDACSNTCGLPPASLSIADASGAEGPNQPAQVDFTITRAGSTTNALNVGLYTRAGTTNAAGSNDYTAVLDGTRLVIPAGATSVTYSVRVTPDTLAELDETFLLSMEYAYESGSISGLPQAAIGTGDGPIGIVAADFDGDGFSDLLVTHELGQSMTVLRNTSTPGSMSFATPASTSLGVAPLWADTGDLDGDGKTDAVIASLGGGQLILARNTSSLGSISFALTTLAAPAATAVAIGDLDGDGKPDVAYSTSSTSVRVLRNTSTGAGNIGFDTAVTVTTPDGTRGLSIGDLDADGKRDIAVACLNAGQVALLRNTSTTGSLAFSNVKNLTTGTSPYGVAIGELNGDLYPEVVAANSGSGTLSVFDNGSITPGTFTFSAKQDFAVFAGPQFPLVRDYDGDGQNDLIVPNTSAGSIGLLRNIRLQTGNSISFDSQRIFSIANLPTQAVATDLDGDGQLDIASTRYSADAVQAVLNDRPSVTLTDADATGTIVNDDEPVVAFSATTSSVNESAGTATITVTMTGVSSQTVDVSYSVSGTATQNSDYTLSPATLSFAPNETSKTITVSGLADASTDADPTETVILTLQDPANAALGSNTTHTLTITNDSNTPQPVVAFSLTSSSVNESYGTTTIAVTKSGTTADTVEVSYTIGGTATQGADYTLSPSTLSFAPGEASKVITVGGLTDAYTDGPSTETVVLTLSAPSNATLGTNTVHTLTINNDSNTPPPPVIEFLSAATSVNESNGTTTITVTKSGSTSQTVNVSYTLGGTATQGADYTLSPATLSFASTDVSKTITVSGLNDAYTDPASTETLVLTLQAPSNATLGANTVHTLTITNDSNTGAAQAATGGGGGGSFSWLSALVLLAARLGRGRKGAALQG